MRELSAPFSVCIVHWSICLAYILIVVDLTLPPPPFRQVTDSINSLVNVCTSAAPGQRECDNAIRQIQSLQPLLTNPTEPVSDSSYFECLETVMDKSRSLGG